MAKTEQFNFRAEPKLLAKLRKLAKRGFGGNVTVAIEKLVDFYFSFSPNFMIALHETEARLGRSQSDIIEAIVLRALATEQAHLEVFGKVSPRCFTEFVPRGGRVLKGADLFDAMKEEAVQIFERMKEEQEAGTFPVVEQVQEMVLESAAC